MNKGENMKKMLKIVALLSVMIGNFAIFQSNANALVSVDGYFRSNGTYVALTSELHLIVLHLITSVLGNKYY